MMITATCNNTTCAHAGTPYNVGGNPPRVMCGTCRAWCDLTDPRDDPPEPEDPAA